MRDKIYLAAFLLAAGFLLYLGRDLLPSSVLLTWGLTFGGTSAISILLVVLYRVQAQLSASRHELARKEAELHFALEVQKALFPRRFPCNQGLEFSGACIPARGISGDYYDVLSLPDGRLAFAIADISGKGISAAILMANLQALLRTHAPASPTPGQLCAKLNNHLADVMDESRFATLFYAEWDPRDNILRYVNAGHNVPITLGSLERARLTLGGYPLGIFPGAEFEVGEARLQHGDVLVLYSDGITEATSTSGEEFGELRLRELMEKLRGDALSDLPKRVIDEVLAWSGKDPHDDMTIVIVRANQKTMEVP